MRRQHLTPRPQPARLWGDHGRLQRLAVLLVGGEPPQAQSNIFHLVGHFAGTDQAQQPFGGVEVAVGVVIAERPVVGPRVARLAQLTGESLAHAAQGVAERIPALADLVRDVLGDNPQLHLRIHPLVGAVGDALLLVFQCNEAGPRGAIVQHLRHGPFDELVERWRKQLEHLADAVAVGSRHGQSPHSMIAAGSAIASPVPNRTPPVRPHPRTPRRRGRPARCPATRWPRC